MILLTTTAFSAEKNNMKNLKWFEKIGCEKLQITEYKSAANKKKINELTITDVEYIRTFQARINQLPAAGDKMVKMGPDADYLVLEFACGEKVETIEFYNNTIKTPDTSFFSRDPRPDKEVWNQIQTHFKKADYGIPLPKVAGHSYEFKKLKVSYVGHEDRTPKDTTASLYAETFAVTDLKTKKTENVEVFSGQLPPEPTEFSVGADTFVIHTFSDKNGVRVDPLNFIIYKKK